MKVLGQTLKDGSVHVFEAPAPVLRANSVRVRVHFSAVSTGTEGNKVVTGKKSLLGKARAKPDQVRQVMSMASEVGLKATWQKVRDKLEGAQSLGYSLAGEVLEVGSEVDDLEPGQLVACAGGDAHHASEVVVSRNLVARVPDGVPLDSACMTTLCAIALQGVRLAGPSIGESAVVVGLGAIGLLAAQVLRANGCRVYGADVDPNAVDLARSTESVDECGRLGIDPVEDAILGFSRGVGADLVLICASTSSNDPVALAGRVSRKRGRVIVIGAVGMDIPRADYYVKELQFAVSCSYGPGRYDPSYEDWGQDYPVGYVRWTEGRNMLAALDLMAAGRVDPRGLVSHRFAFEEAPKAYEMIAERTEPYCGVLLEYGDLAEHPGAVNVKETPGDRSQDIGLGFVGCGSFAQSFLMPSFRRQSDCRLVSISTRGGLTAVDVATRSGIEKAVESAQDVIVDEGVNAVVITTRHDQHAPLVLESLRAGKNVFVEKPLCTTVAQLEEVAALTLALAQSDGLPVVHVGYNRRFSKAALACRNHFRERQEPLTMLYRINAGRLPADHWIQHPIEGGGRVVGEVCHFLDLMQFLCGANPTQIQSMTITSERGDVPRQDDISLTLKFADGSLGCILYSSGGAKRLPKEEVTVHGAGRSAVIDNFRSVTLYGSRAKRRVGGKGKGHDEEVRAFVEAIRSGKPPVAMESLLATSAATLVALDAMTGGTTQRVPSWQELAANHADH